MAGGQAYGLPGQAAPDSTAAELKQEQSSLLPRGRLLAPLEPLRTEPEQVPADIIQSPSSSPLPLSLPPLPPIGPPTPELHGLELHGLSGVARLKARARDAFLHHEHPLAHVETLHRHEAHLQHRACSGARYHLSCGRQQDGGVVHRLMSLRLKEQGSGDWWTAILSSERYYSSSGSSDGGGHHWDSALNELKKQLDPSTETGVGVLKARNNLQHRDVVGATVLHACILSYGANSRQTTAQEVESRLAERAFHLATYLIQNYGPKQFDQKAKHIAGRTSSNNSFAQLSIAADCADEGVDERDLNVDLVNRSYFFEQRGGAAGTAGPFNGETALHMAIVYGSEPLVRLLLDCGACMVARAYGSFFKPSGSCYYGELPLNFAVSCGNLRIAYLLIDHVRTAPARRAKAFQEEAFLEWDRNHDGAIAFSELEAKVDEIGGFNDILPGARQHFFDSMDTDGDHEISREEFHKWMEVEREKHDNLVVQQDRVRRLISQTDCIGNTALHMAVIHKEVEIFDWLLDKTTCTGCHEWPPPQEALRQLFGFGSDDDDDDDDETAAGEGEGEGEAKVTRKFRDTVKGEIEQRYEKMKREEREIYERLEQNSEGQTKDIQLQDAMQDIFVDAGLRHTEEKARQVVARVDYDRNGMINTHEFTDWWWGGSWARDLLLQENSSGLSVMTLAALAGDAIMFTHVLEASRVPKWTYGPVSCHEMPLSQLDTLRDFDLPESVRCPSGSRTAYLPEETEQARDKRLITDHPFERSVMLIVLGETVESIADNVTLAELQDLKWTKFGKVYFYCSLLCYFGYIGLLWCLAIAFVDFTETEERAMAQELLLVDEYDDPSPEPAGTTLLTAAAGRSPGGYDALPTNLKAFEFAVFICTVIQAILSAGDGWGVHRAQKMRTDTIKQARKRVKRRVDRSLESTKERGFYPHAAWYADGKADQAGMSDYQFYRKRRQDEAYEAVRDSWSLEPQRTNFCERILSQVLPRVLVSLIFCKKVSPVSEEIKYIGPADFTQQIELKLTFYQWITIWRIVFCVWHFGLVMANNDGSYWWAKMLLAVCAPLAHIQLFEFACGHRGSGHLMIVIARAFKKNISTFMAVLSVYVLGASQLLYVLGIDVAAVGERDSSPSARIVKSWLALFRVATGEKPQWGKADQDWESDAAETGQTISDWKRTAEQIFVYSVYVLFVILVFIILLRLLISMFNETYGEVKKNRDQIWRIQRGLFILMAERRLCTIARMLSRCPLPGTYHGTPVYASIGQRLLCHMWLGDTVQVIDNAIHVDPNDGISRTKTKDDLEKDAIHELVNDAISLDGEAGQDDSDTSNLFSKTTLQEEREDEKEIIANKIRIKLAEAQKGNWTIQPGPHSHMQTTSTLPARWAAAHKTARSVRTAQMQDMQDAKMKAKVLGKQH
jgi:Ca2+-binding EF-hand superfamily protein